MTKYEMPERSSAFRGTPCFRGTRFEKYYVNAIHLYTSVRFHRYEMINAEKRKLNNAIRTIGDFKMFLLLRS